MRYASHPPSPGFGLASSEAATEDRRSLRTNQVYPVAVACALFLVILSGAKRSRRTAILPFSVTIDLPTKLVGKSGSFPVDVVERGCPLNLQSKSSQKTK